jgi:hypothetical protein
MSAFGAFVNTAWDAIILDSHLYSDNRRWNPGGTVETAATAQKSLSQLG